jgi:hypothetical protein
MNILAKKRKWWIFHSRIHPKIPGDIAFIIGPYLFSSLWILKLSYGRYPLYSIINTITHFLFSFPGMNFLKRLGIVSLERMSPIKLVLLMEFRAFLLYGFQFLMEKIKPFKVFNLTHKKI